jgi:hypothetical protein
MMIRGTEDRPQCKHAIFEEGAELNPDLIEAETVAYTKEFAER